MEVTGIIEYIAKSNQEQRDIIVVDIDGQEVQISLFAFPARPDISVDGIEETKINFIQNQITYFF